MALKVGELYAAMSLDDKAFKSGLSRMKSTMKGAAKAIGVSILAITVAVLAMAKEATGNAVEQERANARVSAVYKKSAADVNAWAVANATSMGVNDDVLQQSMAKYGMWAKNVGFSTKQAISQGKAMAKRAEEIARSTGKPFEEVFDALMKGAQGSTRGLKEFGVAVSPLAIKNEALRLGLIGAGDALTDEAKAAALNSLIMKQTAGYTKSAADAQDDLAFKSRQMGTMVDQVMDQVGAVILNLVTTVVPPLLAAFAGVAAWFAVNQATITDIATTIFNAIGTALNALKSAIDFIMPIVMDAFNWLTNNGKSMEPVFAAIAAVILLAVVPAIASLVLAIGPILLAIGAVIAIVAVLTKAWMEDWGGIRTTLMTVWGNIKPIFQTVVTWLQNNIPGALRILQDVFGRIFSFIAQVVGVQIAVVTQVLGVAGQVLRNFVTFMTPIVAAIMTAWGPLSKFFGKLWTGISSGIKGALNFMINVINGMISALNSIQIHFEGGPGGVGKFDWNGFNINKLPHLATGTPNWKGGMAMLGEQGPEVAYLPKGTRVDNAGATRDMMGGQGKSEVHYHVEVQGLVKARDPFQIVHQLQRLANVSELMPAMVPE